MGVLFWQMIRASSSIAPIWKRIRFPFIREPAPFFYRSFRYPLCDHLCVERDFAGRLARGEPCGQLVVAGSVLHRIRVEVEPLVVTVVLVPDANRAVAVEMDESEELAL